MLASISWRVNMVIREEIHLNMFQLCSGVNLESTVRPASMFTRKTVNAYRRWIKALIFIHVDGDHSFSENCFHDLQLLSMSTAHTGTVLLVDDYTYVQDVKNAVDIFIRSYAHRISQTEMRPSLRGEFIIRVK